MAANTRADELAAQWSAAEQALAAGDGVRAFALADGLLQRARSLGHSGALASALLLCAEALHLQARNEPAHAAALEACSLLQNDADTPGRLRGIVILAGICREVGDLARAAEHARQGIDLAVRHNERETTLRLLYGLAQVLLAGDEYEESIRCLSEALARHDQWPECLPDHRLRCATELALIRIQYGERLSRAGHHERARAQWHAARTDTAAPFVPAQREGDDALHALANRIELLAWCQDDAGARADASTLIRLARRRTGSCKTMARTCEAVSTLHQRAGRTSHAIAQQRRRLGIARDLSCSATILHCARRLAALHAELGRYADALAWQMQASVVRVEARQTSRALRQNMRRLEWLASEHRTRADEAQRHGECVQILGRLLGQILHALKMPTQQVHTSLGKVLESIDATTASTKSTSAGAELRQQLKQAVEAIDVAAALVQQLKLFCYRSAPKTQVVSLERALFEAWLGLGLHQPLNEWSLSMQPVSVGIDRSVVFDVEADAQRLGILLKLLLLGMTSLGERQRESRALSASVACSEPGTTSLFLSRADGHAAASGDRWGHRLCTELATEMGGRLTAVGDVTSPRSFELLLPSVVQTL
jgi:tetratricopeptide (TPR) repeat protein